MEASSTNSEASSRFALSLIKFKALTGSRKIVEMYVNGLDKVTAGHIRAVARSVRAEERYVQVSALVDPPYRQGLAEVLIIFLQSHWRGNIEQPADPDRGIHHEPGYVRESLAELSLQERVQNYVQVFQVIEEIRNSVTHRFRRDFYIVPCNRGHDMPVQRVIEFIEGPVGIFIRVRVDFSVNDLIAGATRKQGRCE